MSKVDGINNFFLTIGCDCFYIFFIYCYKLVLFSSLLYYNCHYVWHIVLLCTLLDHWMNCN